MSVSTEHKGYKVVFDEANNQWACEDLTLSHENLGKLREAVDRELLKVRKKAALPVLHISDSGRLTEGVAVDSRPFRYGRTARTDEFGHEIGVMVPSSSGKGTKVWRDPCHLAPDTEETRALLGKVRDAEDAVTAARLVVRDALAAIPRIKPADVAGLIEACETKLGGDDAS